jgi:hypothetical protein
MNVIFPSTPRSSKWSLSLNISSQIPVRTFQPLKNGGYKRKAQFHGTLFAKDFTLDGVCFGSENSVLFGGGEMKLQDIYCEV